VSILIRRAAVATAALLGALFAVGSLISILFELQGFGGERDRDPSVPYVALLMLGFVASVAVPLLLWRALLPSAPGRLLAAILAGAAAAVLLVLGVSLR
jgi:hypothetical protein